MVSLMPYLRIGSTVEVASSDEGFLGSWYTAIVVKRGSKNSTVKYCTLLEDTSAQPLVERLSNTLMRPVPPPLAVKVYEEGDAVEAYDRDGWWVGTVCKVLPDDKCVVYFRETGDEVEYHTSKMRLRQDWLNGIWIRVYERRNPSVEAYRKQGLLGVTPVKVLKTTSKASVKLTGRRRGLHDIETEPQVDNNLPQAPRRKKLRATCRDDEEILLTPTTNPKQIPESIHRKTQSKKSSGAENGFLAAIEKPVPEDREFLVNTPTKQKRVDLESPNSCGRPRRGSDLSSESNQCTLRSTQIMAYSSVLRAFHLQGPGLTWQQEQLITDLRCQLEIDNDVHINQLESLEGWECRCHCSNCSRKVHVDVSGQV